MRGAVLFSLALLAVGACTFPDVMYAPPDGSTASDATPGRDGNTGDAPATEDGGGGDATVDATEDNVADVVNDSVFEAAPEANPCDKDGDGHLDANNKAVCGSKADDCCDTDVLAHPGQTMPQTAPDRCQSFDYNCDGKLEAEYQVNLMQTCGGLSLTGCQGTGFIGDPGCGGTGPYGNCSVSGLSCTAQTISEMPTQACL